MCVESEKEADKKPKRVFAYGGGSSAFSQIMRAEMGKAGDQGPRKIDSFAKEEYKQISTTQANVAKEKAEQIKNQKQATFQPKEEKKEPPKIDWRKGFFRDPDEPKEKEQADSEKQ